MGNYKGDLVKKISKHNLEPMGETLCLKIINLGVAALKA